MTKPRHPGLPLIPAPLPDETLYSFVTRIHLVSGNRHPDETLEALAGRRAWAPRSVFPSRLAHLASATGIHAEAIRECLTFFPLLRPFISTQRARLIAEGMDGGNGRALAMASGHLRGGFRWPSRPRLCRRCVEQDMERFGLAYWHRAHQMPVVLACPEHPEQRLSTAELRDVRRARRVDLRLPDECIADAERDLLPRGLRPGIARLAADLLLAALPSIGSERLTVLYRERLAELGFLTASGRLRQSAIHESLRGHLAPLRAGLLAPALAIQPNSHSDWPAKTLRAPRGDINALKHVLLIEWLFGDLATFRAALHEAPARTHREEKASCTNEGPSDETIAALLHEKDATLRSVAANLGCSVTSLAVKARALGLEPGRRPKRVTDAVEQRIVAALLTGQRVQDVAVQNGVSEVTVRRVIRAQPRLRARLEARRLGRERARRRAQARRFRKRHPEATIGGFQSAEPATYSWFQRHDPEWLRGLFPRAGRHAGGNPAVDWPSRDRALADAIAHEGQAMLGAPGRPRHLSCAALLRAVDAQVTFDKHRARLPMTEAALQQWTESRNAYQLRRIVWAAGSLRATCGEAPAWRIRRLAGLNASTAADVEIRVRELSDAPSIQPPGAGCPG
ncbi:TnsD family Tn7-like transposition protein [Sediminicurvatus halobius]|uniref:Uncharacterized protein n=1 Tax=Sediminicurvatus halobius TaxID=2182432 RepID=A0A2U2N2S9_9GAMM|nr:TnsD family Tn7-like transposition protein [Spiribacter halobius]PWG63357.1 hypothetical protein DEM34_08595 [Spiribacter halobius]UEX78027.1 TnsD family transposase [Spiribacter halobius]